METVSHVDLRRFMGNWYVIANIPTFFERKAHNATESYALKSDGSIHTTFRYQHGGFDGDIKEMSPTAYVLDKQTNARWGMQFIWPFKADYRIVYLDPAYDATIIGRKRRDYVWLMARSPEMSDARYERMLDRIEKLGYERDKVRRVPQQWD